MGWSSGAGWSGVRILVSPSVSGSLLPTSNDGGALGSATLSFSDLFLASGGVINWNNGDVTLLSDATNVLAQRNGTAGQTFRIYESFTDASNYSRLNARFDGVDTFVIDSQAAGTGTARALHIGPAGGAAFAIRTGGNVRWIVDGSDPAWYPNSDNLADVGQLANRSRTIYAGTSLQLVGANAQAAALRQTTESHTLAAAATSDTTITAPANSLVIGVTIRVTTTITGCTTLDVGVAGATTRYGTGIALTSGTTNVSPGTTNPTIYGAATAIRFTAVGGGASFTAGVIRITIHYIDLTAPTS